MDTITYAQVQELVKRLPTKKLSLAYRLLISLAENEEEGLSPQLDLMLLPTAERQRLMKQQAEQMVSHYQQTAAEREAWQAGDFYES
jgi:hypothetical protein